MARPTLKDKARITKWLRKWQGLMFLQEWFFDFAEQSEQEGTTLMSIDARPRYMEATINVYPEFWRLTLERQENCLIHEMSHCLTEMTRRLLNNANKGEIPSRSEIEFHNEQLTQRIANIVQALGRR